MTMTVATIGTADETTTAATMTGGATKAMMTDR
jgi:hypothetical protein